MRAARRGDRSAGRQHRAGRRWRAVAASRGAGKRESGGSAAWRRAARRVLSTRRLRDLGPVDLVASQVTAGAGVTIADLDAHARMAGLGYGVDLASRDSATVAGTIATNAGGVHTVRYGFTRAQLLGLEAVLADGAVVSRLAGLTSDNAGYDLPGLLAGSEGTLGVITAARLRLWPVETALTTLLAGVDDIDAAAALFADIRAGADRVQAAEYFEAEGVELVRELTGLPLPLGREYPAYLLAETAGADAAERLAGFLRSRTRRSPPTRAAGTGCGRTANGTPRRSARRASRTSWTWPSRWAHSGPSARRSRTWSRARGRSSSGISAWAICTSTSSGPTPATTASTRRCCALPPSTAAGLRRARDRPGEGTVAAAEQVRRGDRGDAGGEVGA